MKKWKKITGVVLMILFAYIYAHVAKTESVEAEFICQAESLDGIAIKCLVPEELSDEKVCMILTDMERNYDEASVEMEARELKEGKYNVFAFEKIEKCQGKSYKVTVENAEVQGVKTVTKGFDVETFGVVILLLLYIIFFFRLLIKLFSR